MPRAPETAPISLPRPKCCLETRLRWQLAISALEVSAQQGDELCKFQDLIGGGGAGKHYGQAVHAEVETFS